MVKNSKNVHFPALAQEIGGQLGHTLLHIKNSSDISILGSAGIYILTQKEETAMINIKNSSNIELLGLTKHPKPSQRRIKGNWVEDDGISIKDEKDQLIYYKK